MEQDKPPQQNPAQNKMDPYTRQGGVAHRPGTTGSFEESTTTPASTDLILFAIKESKEAVEQKEEEVRVDVSLLQQDLGKVADRVTETEKRISTTEDEITMLKTQVTQTNGDDSDP